MNTVAINGNSVNTNQRQYKNPRTKNDSLLAPPKSEDKSGIHVDYVDSIAPVEKQHGDTPTSLGRKTYGLSILELMDDYDYAVFDSITKNMRDSERMLAAQSLYHISDLGQKGSYSKGVKNGYGNTLKFPQFFERAYLYNQTGFIDIDERI